MLHFQVLASMGYVAKRHVVIGRQRHLAASAISGICLFSLAIIQGNEGEDENETLTLTACLGQQR